MADHAVRGAALVLDLGVDVGCSLAVGSHVLVGELLAVLIGVVPLVETALTGAVALDPGLGPCCTAVIVVPVVLVDVDHRLAAGELALADHVVRALHLAHSRSSVCAVVLNVGALIIRIGFGGVPYYNKSIILYPQTLF